MEQMDYWNRFVTTGRVTDYLQYRNAQGTKNLCGRYEEGKGDNERNSYAYRDDSDGISHERIR